MNEKGTRKHITHTLFQQSPISMESHIQVESNTRAHTQQNNNRSALAVDSNIRFVR